MLNSFQNVKLFVTLNDGFELVGYKHNPKKKLPQKIPHTMPKGSKDGGIHFEIFDESRHIRFSVSNANSINTFILCLCLHGLLGC